MVLINTRLRFLFPPFHKKLISLHIGQNQINRAKSGTVVLRENDLRSYEIKLWQTRKGNLLFSNLIGLPNRCIHALFFVFFTFHPLDLKNSFGENMNNDSSVYLKHYLSTYHYHYQLLSNINNHFTFTSLHWYLIPFTFFQNHYEYPKEFTSKKQFVFKMNFLST